MIRVVEAAIRAARAAYVATVEDPHRTHLHYEGCPYKPFAALPRWEVPEDAPACTCAEVHKAAYWKGQFVLERGARALARSAALDEAQRAVCVSCRHGVARVTDAHGTYHVWGGRSDGTWRTSRGPCQAAAIEALK